MYAKCNVCISTPLEYVYFLLQNNFTPLHQACQYGHELVVKTLVQYNADIECITNVS